jgi:hypothetical protein
MRNARSACGLGAREGKDLRNIVYYDIYCFYCPMSTPSLLPIRLLVTLGMAGLTGSLEAQWFQQRNAPPTPTPMPPQQVHSLPNPYAQPVQAQPLPETTIFRSPFQSPPSWSLPYEGYRYQRSSRPTKISFFGNPKPSPEMLQLLEVIRMRAEHIAKFGLPYRFGGDHPSKGGLDCSGTMKYLLSDIGFSDMPRTSYDQYAWLRQARTLRHTKSIPDHMGGRKGIKPGDLIFWGGTYDSGHRVSHVMIYLGQGKDGTHYMFGARGKDKRGLNGSGVDVFRLPSGYQKNLVGFGSLPGVS